MRKLVLVLALILGGCATSPSVSLNTAVTLNSMEGVIAAYGTALSAERAYKSLPLCLTGTRATITNPCAQRSIIVRLQAADLTANRAINRANTYIKTYPTLNASNVISAAVAAVQALQSILAGV